MQRNARGPQVVLSRTSPGLLIKLFEMEVPEIYEGIVRIETAAREPEVGRKLRCRVVILMSTLWVLVLV